MLKDRRKTKENTKNQEKFLNYIKEYFAEAPITISNDKTKLYIEHNDYPISLENTSIIEKFTNKNKGMDFTKEQAIKEAEILRNELAIEVKNYKAVEVDLIQKLIKQYFNQLFTYKDCDADYKLVFDSNYPSTFKLHYQNGTYDFDFEDIISEFLADKRLVDIPFTDVSEFSEAITVGKICDSGYYEGLVYGLLDSITLCNIDVPDITLDSEGDGRIFFDLGGENITCPDYHALYVDITRDMKENAYDDFVSITDYVLSEIELFVSKISDGYKEQEECAKFAEENYEKDIEQLITNLESEIKIKYPDFEIYDKYIHASKFKNSDFICVVEINDYKIKLDITDYVFNQSGFGGFEDMVLDLIYENYCYDAPYVNKFDYEAFLESVQEKLFKLKKEILEDLSK